MQFTCIKTHHWLGQHQDQSWTSCGPVCLYQNQHHSYWCQQVMHHHSAPRIAMLRLQTESDHRCCRQGWFAHHQHHYKYSTANGSQIYALTTANVIVPAVRKYNWTKIKPCTELRVEYSQLTFLSTSNSRDTKTKPHQKSSLIKFRYCALV